MENTYGKPFTFPFPAAAHPSGSDLAEVPCSEPARRSSWVIPTARSRKAQLCGCLMCQGVSRALGLDNNVKTLACHLEVLLPSKRGQWHVLPIQMGTSTQSLGVSLPLLDDI